MTDKARPTDPVKLAAYLARRARNQANYRARQAAALQGTRVPAAARLKRPANYRPARVRPAPQMTIVQRAQLERDQQRARRNEIISSLPNIASPKTKLRIKEETERFAPERKTIKGLRTQAAAIRLSAENKKIAVIGKARKQQLITELEHGPQADRLKEILKTKAERQLFQQLSEQIAKGSNQAVGIFFEHSVGHDLYVQALDRFLTSQPDVEAGFNLLHQVAEYAQKAAIAYAPKAIGTITV